MRRWLALLFAITAFGACELGSEPSAEQRIVGIIDAGAGTLPDGYLVVIAAPDTVTVGTPFDATISTVGNAGCWREDGADVSAETRLAVVTPFDLVMTKVGGAPAVCLDLFVKLPRTVRLVFGQTGVATLRVSGRKMTGGELSSATPTTVEKQIVVR